ncbi:MAG: glycosyltransferase [Ruminococcus flavefaciens]|nr:glycosyltransferase [Ruminococcus flavefaciens]MCM1229454.1 glycosyltransferase [Ruminococcus flavefaciens]
MRKIKVLEVNKAYFPHTGGIESLVKQYSEELRRYCAVKTLVCRDDRGKTVADRVNGVKITRAGSFGTYFSCPLSLSFIRLFKKMSADADIVHIHVPFPLADLALLLSGYKGKVAVSWHSDIVRQKKLMILYKPFLMYLLRRADIIFTATQGHIDNSEYLTDFRDKCRILPYGITPEDYLAVERAPFLTDKLTDKTAVKVFFTGRLVYYKGVDVLLKAFTRIKDCELFIAGTGELEKPLKAFAESHNLGGKVHFLGFLPDSELKQAYADCDIFVLPSVARSEAFGIVQLEAMIYGKPVINTNLPSGVPYVSIHGRTGITVPPSDPKSLAEAINRLAGDKNLRTKLGRNAQKRVIRDFNEKQVITELYRLLSEEVSR